MNLIETKREDDFYKKESEGNNPDEILSHFACHPLDHRSNYYSISL